MAPCPSNAHKGKSTREERGFLIAIIALKARSQGVRPSVSLSILMANAPEVYAAHCLCSRRSVWEGSISGKTQHLLPSIECSPVKSWDLSPASMDLPRPPPLLLFFAPFALRPLPCLPEDPFSGFCQMLRSKPLEFLFTL